MKWFFDEYDPVGECMRVDVEVEAGPVLDKLREIESIIAELGVRSAFIGGVRYRTFRKA